MMEKMTATDWEYYYIIRLISRKPMREQVSAIKWTGLRFEMLAKWQWYFSYRAALLQVQHPRHIVEHNSGKEPASKKVQGQEMTNRIKGKKSKITEMKNKLFKAEQTWQSLFPIQDDKLYQRCVAKIKRYEAELDEILKAATTT